MTSGEYLQTSGTSEMSVTGSTRRNIPEDLQPINTAAIKVKVTSLTQNKVRQIYTLKPPLPMRHIPTIKLPGFMPLTLPVTYALDSALL